MMICCLVFFGWALIACRDSDDEIPDKPEPPQEETRLEKALAAMRQHTNFALEITVDMGYTEDTHIIRFDHDKSYFIMGDTMGYYHRDGDQCYAYDVTFTAAFKQVIACDTIHPAYTFYKNFEADWFSETEDGYQANAAGLDFVKDAFSQHLEVVEITNLYLTLQGEQFDTLSLTLTTVAYTYELTMTFSHFNAVSLVLPEVD